MSQDFVYINPQNIPPRRIAPKKSRNLRRKRRDRYLTELEMKENYNESFPEFDLASQFAGQIILSQAPGPAPEDPENFFEFMEETDPLTQAIFGEPETRRETRQASYRPGAAARPVLPQTPPPKTSEEERAELMAELEKINEADQGLLKRITRLTSPRRVGPVKIKSEPSKISLTEIQAAIRPALEQNYGEVPEEENIRPPAEDLARAESDWFGVGLARKKFPAKLPDVRNYRAEEEHEESSENTSKIKTFLAGLAIFLIPVTFGFFVFSGGPNFIKAAVGSFNSKLLSTASFTLINVEENSTFLGLVETRNNIAAANGPTESIDLIDKFLENNSGFSWLNIFKKKVLGSSAVSISGLELLDKTQENLTSLASASFKNPKKDLAEEVSFFNFWNQLFSPDKQYLVVMTDTSSSRPIGGRPVSYTLIKTTSDSLEIVSSGKFSELDASFEAKIVPPQPIQVISTAWLPSEAGWFLSFGESAQTLLSFFDRTTQNRTDGLVVVSKDFLKDIGFRESLIFDPESPSWFYALSDALAHKPSQRWVSLAKTFNEGLANHKIQFYFKDGFLEKYVNSQNWSLSVKTVPREDALGVVLASLKGSGSELDLIEHKPSIFEDGSIVVKLSVSVRQSAGESTNYFKIYLPKGTQVLKANGFSEKQKIPVFDYSANNFNRDGRLGLVTISDSKEVENVDVFEETGASVVGGWVKLGSGDRKKINLEYLLPFRLPRKSAFTGYRLKVWRSPQAEDVPFRFGLTPEKGASVVSLEPDGFVSENSGEYQGNLTQDLTLEAGLVFGGE